jgi:hypothetical protein
MQLLRKSRRKFCTWRVTADAYFAEQGIDASAAS